jgi:hypothetical protein
MPFCCGLGSANMSFPLQRRIARTDPSISTHPYLHCEGRRSSHLLDELYFSALSSFQWEGGNSTLEPG